MKYIVIWLKNWKTENATPPSVQLSMIMLCSLENSVFYFDDWMWSLIILIWWWRFYYLNVEDHTFKSDIIFRKSVNEPYVSKSSKCRRCGTIFCGLGSVNGTGKSSFITLWCVMSARSDGNSLVKPCKRKNTFKWRRKEKWFYNMLGQISRNGIW